MIDRKTIAAMIGVSPSTLRQNIEPRPDFPKPALRLSQKTVRWEKSDIERWLKTQRARA